MLETFFSRFLGCVKYCWDFGLANYNTQRVILVSRKKLDDLWLTHGALLDLVTKFDRQGGEEGELSERLNWDIQAR